MAIVGAKSSSAARSSLPAVKSQSAFNEAAAEIARGVHKTSQVLAKLTKLVQSQGLFDDPTEEINGLIFRIKQELGDLLYKISSQKFQDPADGEVQLKKYFSDLHGEIREAFESLD